MRIGFLSTILWNNRKGAPRFPTREGRPKLERRRGVDERLARLIQTTYLNSVELWCRKFSSGSGRLNWKANSRRTIDSSRHRANFVNVSH